MGKRNQERRRARKKERDARQRSRAGTRPRFGPDPVHDSTRDGFGDGFVDGPGFGPPRRRSMAEVVDEAVASVVYAPEHVATKTVEDAARVLDRGVSTAPDGLHGLSCALLVAAERLVRGCWERHWQPADLARITRRRLTAQHVRLAVDVVAAEMRRYPAAGLDPRWSGQLRDLGAEVWWGDDGRHLGDLAAREGLTLAAALTCMLDLFRLLARLPALPPVGPVPGSRPARSAGHRPHAPDEASSRALDRIRALLAKAESTEYPEEAETLSAKAQELMARHSISAALLAAETGAEDEPGCRRVGIDNPYEAPKSLLLEAVAQANRCRAVWSSDLGFATVVGYEPDLEATEVLYTSLLVQATRAMTRAGSRRNRYGQSRTRAFRQSFLVAYAQRIGERLSDATEQATTDAAGLDGAHPDRAAAAQPGLLPVLARRAEAVDGAMAEMFPHMTTRAVSVNDREGWAHGTAAADRAVLHDRAEMTP